MANAVCSPLTDLTCILGKRMSLSSDWRRKCVAEVNRRLFREACDLQESDAASIPSVPSSMGQFLEKIRGPEWREAQMKKISDKVYDKVKNQSEKATLSFEDLYIATLLVYNEINKLLPGPHNDPPSRERVRELMKKSDINLDREIDREEFLTFIKLLTSDTVITVSQGLILTLVVAPTIAVVTKKRTEGVPGVGKLVHKLPTSIYASLITLAALTFHNSRQGAC